MTSRLLLCYRPPGHVESDSQGKLVLAEIVAAFCDMRPSDGEWDHVWAEFRRTWTKTYWPLPSEFCRLLAGFRARQAALQQAGRGVDRAAEARAASERPYNHGEFLSALRKARAMAGSRDNRTAKWGASVLRLGEALEKHRDDNDQPRDARRREMEIGT